MTYLTSANEAAIITAESQITTNCGFPNGRGTERWAVVKKAYGQDLWFIPKPDENGWSDGIEIFTQESMLSGVDSSEIVEQEYNPAWFEPIEEV